MKTAQGNARRLAAPFLGLAALCCLFAFVGLGVTSYWIDELFTLFVIDHDGGLGEVLSRALTDTHPPAYYFLAYGWIHALGSGEASLRAFAALCAVGAVVCFFLVLKPWFSLPARAFAVLIAASSTLTFDFAQTARSYSLCVLIAVGLMGLAMAIAERARTDQPVSMKLIAPFWLLSLLASYTHFYLFLEVGGLHLFFLLVAPWRSKAATRFRILTAVSGALLVGAMIAYVLALLSGTRQDLQNMWFQNTPSFLARQLLWAVGRTLGGGIAAVVILAMAPWGHRMRQAAGRPAAPLPSPPLWPMAMAGVVIATVLMAGLTVSFTLAPSFGKRNLLVFAPFLWLVPAWLWDAIAPDVARPGGKALVALLFVCAGLNAVQLPLRFKPRDEDWRASAALVASLPGCRQTDIAVVQPWIFGPSTPFFRDLAARYFYGRYYPSPDRLHPFTPEEFDSPPPALKALLTRQGACPVVAWGVHDLNKAYAAALREDIERAAGARLEERVFVFRRPGAVGFSKKTPGAWVWLRP